MVVVDKLLDRRAKEDRGHGNDGSQIRPRPTCCVRKSLLADPIFEWRLTFGRDSITGVWMNPKVHEMQRQRRPSGGMC